MRIFAIVPVKGFLNSKSRLSAVLSPEERAELSSRMLEDTLASLSGCPQLSRIVVVSSDRRAEALAGQFGAAFVHEERDSGVNAAVALADLYCTQNGADATLVVPQDIPLLSAGEIALVCHKAQAEERCIVICPSRRFDGTNILLRRPPDAIPLSFDRNSYYSHVASAKERGVRVITVEPPSLMLDLDTPEDAREVVAKGEGVQGRVLEFLRQPH